MSSTPLIWHILILKILQLILEPKTPEPLPTSELLMVRRFINDFFLNHYINPACDNEDFSMPSPETLSKS